MRIIALLLIVMVSSYAGQFDKVKITPEISYMYVYHKGKAVKVHRIQNTKNKITGEYAKIYRPGQDIQPIKMHKDIQTIGEVELLHFMKKKVNKKKGLLVDLRPKKVYKEESIPSAVNIPFKTKNNKTKLHKSSEFIKTFLELGYPADKILYYRGGIQMWKILGFTTVSN
jgi:hypothetical protein